MKGGPCDQREGLEVDASCSQTATRLRTGLCGGTTVTAAITNPDDLGMKCGDAAIGVLKASDVIVAK